MIVFRTKKLEHNFCANPLRSSITHSLPILGHRIQHDVLHWKKTSYAAFRATLRVSVSFCDSFLVIFIERKRHLFIAKFSMKMWKVQHEMPRIKFACHWSKEGTWGTWGTTTPCVFFLVVPIHKNWCFWRAFHWRGDLMPFFHIFWVYFWVYFWYHLGTVQASRVAPVWSQDASRRHNVYWPHGRSTPRTIVQAATIRRRHSELVGGIPTPLKNISSSVGMMKFPIYGKS